MDYVAAIQSYYRCFQERDREGLVQLLTPNFRHVSPFGIYDDRDAMLDAIWPAVGKSWAVDIQVFGEQPDFMVRYRHAGEHAGAMAEYVHFEGDKIAGIEVFIGRSSTNPS
jgi:hypothetical protein